MKNTYTFLEALDRCKPASVWIATSTLKNGGRQDIRAFPARSVDEGGIKTFVLTDSIRDLRDNHNFIIKDACEIRDGTGSYECIEVVPFKLLRKIYPMLITRKVA